MNVLMMLWLVGGNKNKSLYCSELFEILNMAAGANGLEVKISPEEEQQFAAMLLDVVRELRNRYPDRKFKPEPVGIVTRGISSLYAISEACERQKIGSISIPLKSVRELLGYDRVIAYLRKDPMSHDYSVVVCDPDAETTIRDYVEPFCKNHGKELIFPKLSSYSSR